MFYKKEILLYKQMRYEHQLDDLRNTGVGSTDELPVRFGNVSEGRHYAMCYII